MADTETTGRFAESLSEIPDRENVSWSVGLNFRYPVGNRAAKANYAIARIAREQSETNLANTAQTIRVEDEIGRDGNLGHRGRASEDRDERERAKDDPHGHALREGGELTSPGAYGRARGGPREAGRARNSGGKDGALPRFADGITVDPDASRIDLRTRKIPALSSRDSLAPGW